MSIAFTSIEVPYRELFVKSGDTVTDASSDYSSTQGVFQIVSSSDISVNIVVDKIIITLVGTAAATNSSRFGTIAQLTNGFNIKYSFDNTDVHTLGPYKSLLDLDLVSDEHYDETIGTDVIYEFIFKLNVPFILKGGHSDKLYVTLDDNLSGLTGLYFVASGTTNTAKISL